jgi:hypothetical protein
MNRDIVQLLNQTEDCTTHTVHHNVALVIQRKWLAS